MADTPLLTSLGLFIIDENQYPESWNRSPEFDIIGGGLSYAVIGARIVTGKFVGPRISGIIDMGTDFPASLKSEIEKWGTGVIFRANLDRLTTRGVNIYRENGVRDFEYRNPKKRILGKDIIDTAPLLSLRSFHFCCAIDRCEETIDDFLSLTKNNGYPKPKFIFEPFPDICTPQNLENLQGMLHKVDVFSPNLHEAASFYELESSLQHSEENIRGLAEKFHSFQSKNSGVVLRCGELGCYVKTSTISIMIPPYHIDQSKVVDVTGGGNSFCGAFIAALELCGDWIVSAILASIASGIVIEQLGMPNLADEDELWNGESVEDRLKIYMGRNGHLLQYFQRNLITWM